MATEHSFIRRAVLQDLPYFYEICLKTADSGQDASALFNDPYAVGQYYAAPYLFCPGGICFVVEQDRLPQGYIIAAADTGAFNRWMEEQWLPPLRQRYPQPVPPEQVRSEVEGRILARFHTPLPEEPEEAWEKSHPAHLHIDLLPSIQGRGWGRRLMDVLCAELSSRGVPGIHLGVGARNTGAAAFYRRIGFSILQEDTWGLVLGKSLRS